MGSGGNVGAVIFAVFFVYFSYRVAFVLMGLSAIGSAFLCCLLKTDKLAQTYEAVALEVEERNQKEKEASNHDNGNQPTQDQPQQQTEQTVEV